MARFDAHSLANDSLVLDCQADLLSWLETRFVVPLIPEADAPPPIQRLNPTFELPNGRYRMMTQFAATVHIRDLRGVVSSLAPFETDVMNALDMLLTGY